MRNAKLIASSALATLVMAGGGGVFVHSVLAKPAPPQTPSHRRHAQPPKRTKPVHERTVMTDAAIVQQAQSSTVRLIGKTAFGQQWGTGIVIDAAKGLVLTNAHVVSGAGSLSASFNGQDAGPAVVWGTAPCEDLAVVKLNAPPAGLKNAALGDSSTVQAMDHVVAVGFPESPEATPSLNSTSGQVSKPTADVNVDGSAAGDLPQYRSTIQHTAPIAPGNSGGPLFNQYGEVIGINSLGDANNQAWAIASNQAKSYLATLEAGRNQGYVGWSVEPIAQFEQERPDFRNMLRDTPGLIVTGVESNSPAFGAQVHAGDLIQVMNGRPVNTLADVCQVVESRKPGDTVPTSGYKALFADDGSIADYAHASGLLKLQ